jgi:hypothetical protein
MEVYILSYHPLGPLADDNDRIHSMTTLLDHKTTLAYLAYLGYPQGLSTDPSSSSSSSSSPNILATTTALQVTRPRKSDRKKGKVTRNVFLCYVCGAAGSGKTSLLRAFVRKPYTAVYEPTSKPISVVNSVEIKGVEKYLVVSTRDSLMMTRLLISSLLSFKSSDRNTNPRRYEIRKSLTWPTLSYMFMTRAIPIHFLISVTYE